MTPRTTRKVSPIEKLVGLTAFDCSVNVWLNDREGQQGVAHRRKAGIHRSRNDGDTALTVAAAINAIDREDDL